MANYEQEQILIDIIQHYPFLYDKTCRDFKDNNKKSNAWATIASAMSSTADEIQKLWKSIRERYCRERKIIKSMASGSEAPECTWPLYQYMGFLEKHIVSRKRTSNVSKPTSNSSSVVSSPLTSPTGDAPDVWSTMRTVLTSEQDMVEEVESIMTQESQDRLEGMSPPPKKAHLEQPREQPREQPSTSGLQSRKRSDRMVEESLGQITSFLQEKRKPDKNLAFGQYVGLTLMEMPTAEQNYKKLKIVEILNESFES